MSDDRREASMALTEPAGATAATAARGPDGASASGQALRLSLAEARIREYARLRREAERARREEEQDARLEALEAESRRDVARDAARARTAAALDLALSESTIPSDPIHAELDEGTRTLFNIHRVGAWFYADRRQLSRLSLANTGLVVRAAHARVDDFREAGLNALITASYSEILRSFCGQPIVREDVACWTALALWKVYVACVFRRGFVWSTALATPLKQWPSYQLAAVDALSPLMREVIPCLTKRALTDRVAAICAIAIEVADPDTDGVSMQREASVGNSDAGARRQRPRDTPADADGELVTHSFLGAPTTRRCRKLQAP